MAGRSFRIVLIKPSHYDADGYVIQWHRSMIPSTSLSTIYGLLADCNAAKILGPDVEFEIEAYDETNVIIDVKGAIERIRAAGAGFVGLVGVQSNQFPRALDLGREFRAAGLPVIVGGFHVSGCISMLPDLPVDLKAALDLGITLYAGEADFADRAGGFVRDGVDAGEPVLVAVNAAKIELLRKALGDTARWVSFVDMDALGVNPARILPAWRTFAARDIPRLPELESQPSAVKQHLREAFGAAAANPSDDAIGSSRFFRPLMSTSKFFTVSSNCCWCLTVVSSTVFRFLITSPIAWSRSARAEVSDAVWSRMSLMVPPWPWKIVMIDWAMLFTFAGSSARNSGRNPPISASR